MGSLARGQWIKIHVLSVKLSSERKED